ncbi:MAG: hypothetical protein CMJ74_02110 [Planctomycetaceae bacterium]|nr:hypothetical protein [Planctomycetaceae bacterium]
MHCPKSSDDQPDVVYLGLMRAGSTSLRSYFTQHPQIAWRRFAWCLQLGQSDHERSDIYQHLVRKADGRTSDTRCLIEMYESLMLGQYFDLAHSATVREETGPRWSADWALDPKLASDHWPVRIDFAEIARRTKSCFPAARVLIVLRNQITWFESMINHYWGYFSNQDRSLNSFLSTAEGQAASMAGFFDQCILALHRTHGKDNIQVLLLEDLQKCPQSLVDLNEFLSVDPNQTTATQAVCNRGRHKHKRIAIRNRIAAMLPLKLRNSCYQISRADRDLVEKMYRESNARTSELLARDLAAVGYPQ